MESNVSIEVREYRKGSKDARIATIEWLKHNKGMTITDRLIRRYQEEV